MLRVLAILLSLGAFACFKTARTGHIEVGGVTVGRYGQQHQTPVETVALSSRGVAVYYVLGSTFLVGAIYCVAKDRKR